MKLSDFKKAGHWPTLVACFLYFDFSFMTWVTLGPLIVYISKQLNIPVGEKFTLVAIPILAGAILRVPMGILCDHIGAKVTGGIAQLIVIAGVAYAAVFGLHNVLEVELLGVMLGLAGASFSVALPQASKWYPPQYQGIVMGIAGAGNVGTALDALLCSDGIHGVLPDSHIADILGARKGPEETARDLTAAALEQGSSDNATALVIDVLDLPPADRAGLSLALAPLPVAPLPKSGDKIDGFHLGAMLSDGRYTRLFRATDDQDGGAVVLKFPHPRSATEATYKAAFLREAWVAARVRSPWLGTAIALPPGRQTSLYMVMPYLAGETLEQRLFRRPPLSLEEGRGIAVQLCKAVAALHRAGIIHRDIKPDNVILGAEGAKLIDLGVVRVPGLEDLAPETIPGTPSYMAPELFAGEPGDVASDLFALGVTVFRAFTGHYPYGEIEPFTHPRFGKPRSLVALRPDLPAWLDYAVERCLSADPAARFADALELAHHLESGPAVSPPMRRRLPLYQRYPVQFWQVLSAALAVGLLLSLVGRGH